MKNNKGYILVEILIALVLISGLGLGVIKLLNNNLKNKLRLEAREEVSQVNRNFIELLYVGKSYPSKLIYQEFELDQVFEEFQSKNETRMEVDLKDTVVSLEKSNRSDSIWEIRYRIQSKEYEELYWEGRIFILLEKPGGFQSSGSNYLPSLFGSSFNGGRPSFNLQQS